MLYTPLHMSIQSHYNVGDFCEKEMVWHCCSSSPASGRLEIKQVGGGGSRSTTLLRSSLLLEGWLEKTPLRISVAISAYLHRHWNRPKPLLLHYLYPYAGALTMEDKQKRSSYSRSLILIPNVETPGEGLWNHRLSCLPWGFQLNLRWRILFVPGVLLKQTSGSFAVKLFLVIAQTIYGECLYTQSCIQMGNLPTNSISLPIDVFFISWRENPPHTWPVMGSTHKVSGLGCPEKSSRRLVNNSLT